jgi:SAM-dependent methyltransferase
MIAHVSSIYDQPELYRLACAYRNVRAEVDAILDWCGTHWQGGTGQVRSVLELAAGPAEHAMELAGRGLRAAALDRSAAMCAYAASRAKSSAVNVDVHKADMRDFDLQQKYDLAITMLNSVCHLFTLDDLVPHLRAVAGHLVPGGLYIMELAHPADYLAPESRTSSTWTVQDGGMTADVRWGGGDDRIDPVTQITAEHVYITARAADGTTRTVADVVPNRFWTGTEITAAVRLAGGFTIAASYGDFDDSTMVDDPSAWRMIFILRRD